MATSGSADSQEILILAIGGSTRPDSSSEHALRFAAQGAQACGARVVTISGRSLMFPIYDTETAERTPEAAAYVDVARRADGLLVVSPAYHGGISGLVKNALDYLEDLAPTRPAIDADRAYLDGRAVGCIAVANGWQATVSTLHQLRQVVHALRGWPTPLGGTVNTATTHLATIADDDPVAEQLRMIGQQVVEFAQAQRAFRSGS